MSLKSKASKLGNEYRSAAARKIKEKIAQKAERGDAEYMARTTISPTSQAMMTISDYISIRKRSAVEMQCYINEIETQVARVKSNDMTRPEAMLVAQAHTLDAMFGNLARRSVHAQGLRQMETFMRLALKAQSQCRATIETLSVMKNPPSIAFVRQANIAGGPQQVNNGPVEPREPSRAEKSQNGQNELLESGDGNRLDKGASNPAGAIDAEMAPVGELNRTTK